MLPYRDSHIVRFLLVAFFLVVIGYAYFEGRALLYGPTIEVSPRVMEVSDPYITVNGIARRIASLSMNGSPITVTEDGAFEEGYVLTPGYNRIILDARDKYGKSTERIIEVIYNASTTSSSPPVTETTTE